MQTLIKNRALLKAVDFRGMPFLRNQVPTDIDAVIEFDNRLFIFAETKFNGRELPLGQRLALERICACCHSPPDRHAIILKVNHNTQDGDIILKDTIVEQFWWESCWQPVAEKLTYYEAVKKLRKQFLPKHLLTREERMELDDERSGASTD